MGENQRLTKRCSTVSWICNVSLVHYSDFGAASGENMQHEEPQQRGEGEERVEGHGRALASTHTHTLWAGWEQHGVTAWM